MNRVLAGALKGLIVGTIFGGIAWSAQSWFLGVGLGALCTFIGAYGAWAETMRTHLGPVPWICDECGEVVAGGMCPKCGNQVAQARVKREGPIYPLP
ncbi:MAG: hypothetical protein WAO58_02220 [Fimbriimonadaceae bacterium]